MNSAAVPAPQELKPSQVAAAIALKGASAGKAVEWPATILGMSANARMTDGFAW